MEARLCGFFLPKQDIWVYFPSVDISEPRLTPLLKTLSDPGRIRILWLLSQAELAVHELQEILEWGQSRLSTQLGLLRGEGLVQLRREGKWSFYATTAPDESSPEGRILREVLDQWGRETSERERPALRRILEARIEEGLRHFESDPTYLGEESVPARTWEIVARSLFALIPRCRIADLGAGDGILGCMAAAAGHKVSLVDFSARQLERARERAHREGLLDLQYVQANFIATGIPDQSFERILLSHALHHASDPLAVLKEAYRLLVPGGMLWILDLSMHEEEWMRATQGDFWLGFDPQVLTHHLGEAGFGSSKIFFPGSDTRHLRLSSLCATAIR
jgi:ArsR family transcriptional regulator